MSKIIDLSNSPHAKLDGLPMRDVTIDDQFWSPRRKFNHNVALQHQWNECERTGRLDNYRRALGMKECNFTKLAPDSDLYKWLEAVAYSSNHFELDGLSKKLDEFLDLVSRTQDADGYVNSEYTRERTAERWMKLERSHEMYTGGHLLQAAVAHYRATGKRDWLNIATRWADHLHNRFGPGKEYAVDGHPEVEMALVELYRATREKKYLDLAEEMIERRGHNPSGKRGNEHQQDHVPVREQRTVVGHVVRQLYFSAGVADLFAETGDKTLLSAMEDQWRDMHTKMSITGASGVLHRGEGFGKSYDLPNNTAYNETCAAISNFMWNWRLLQITADAKYADLMERVLYNGVLAGASLSEPVYFYTNLLEHDGNGAYGGESNGRGANYRSNVHFDQVACCPPNMARTLASLPGYLYSVSRDAKEIYVHQFVQGRAAFTIKGIKVELKQTTRFPWSGDVEIEVTTASPVDFALNIRIPQWTQDPGATVNGEKTAVSSGYTNITREWKAGDRVRLTLPMPVRLYRSDPRISANTSAVAVLRGPVVYCLESVDQPEIDIRGVSVSRNVKFSEAFEEDLLCGVTTLRATAFYRPLPDSSYSESSKVGAPRKVEIKAVPYFAWANRKPGSMRVWIPLEAGN